VSAAPPGAPFAEVAVPLPVAGPLTYAVPVDLRSLVGPGQRVRVPVGRRTLTGVYWRGLATAPEGFEVRDILAVADFEAILTADLLELARFTADYYFAPLGETVAAMFPTDLPAWGDRRIALTNAGALAPSRNAAEASLRELLLEHGRLRLSELRRRLPLPDLAGHVEALRREGRIALDEPEGRGSRYETAVELAAGGAEEARARAGRSQAAWRVIEQLEALGRPATLDELREGAQASDAVVRRLVRLGALRRFAQPVRLGVDRHLLGAPSGAAAPIVPRADQADAIAEITRAIESRAFARFLLQGMTGSGKTEVYLKAAEATLAAGRTALLLVPEIALVPALARAATDRFGERLAVLHSGMGGAERSQEWERVREGGARIVVGPRSAVFAPIPDLGLIVVDEEQDFAYKQEISPRYHGRDLALVRCRAAGAVAVLASATPSLESRHAAAVGRLTRLSLTERVGSGRLPEGILVDLRTETKVGRPGEVLFSARLLAELGATLEAGDQAILLRNRRGYAPMLLCRACGEDFRCPDCGLARTFHRRAKRLICHYCGSTLDAPQLCPTCRSETLEPLGAGTERVEEELSALIPGVGIDVLDRDSARRVGGAAAILERFRRGETRVLVGTQMLSKGHHFPRVALTAVLSADSYLGFPDFRAVERTYSLLTQLAGRAGRGERPGRVVLQTFHPDHYAIQAALRHDDEAFARQELRFRETFGYPPYSRLALLLSRDRRRERALARLSEAVRRIERGGLHGGVRITGPAPAPFERLRGEWRFQLLLRAPSGAAVRRAVAAALGDRPAGEISADVDPYHLL